jgi:mannose-1-phosphate guanylyltransferase/mannose-6-phosphate isomerase
MPIAAFVEKPDLATAEAYLRSGDYFWNSGMFMFRPSVLLAEMKQYCPGIISACRNAVENAPVDADFVRLIRAHFAASPSISLDYAVMEKTGRGIVIPLDAGWNDVGSWSALAEVSPADASGNQLIGDVLTHNVRNSSIRSSGRLVTAVGVENLIVVETADAILVADMGRVQDVKAIVVLLKKAGRIEAVSHRLVNRPWGTYETVDISQRFLVKRITVNPGARLSLQRHYHRAEHWVVVKGTARITRGDETLVLCEDQSTYIPLGQPHRLENPGRIPLEIIEVQSGSYLNEDDIERIEDNYGRS